MLNSQDFIQISTQKYQTQNMQTTDHKPDTTFDEEIYTIQWNDIENTEIDYENYLTDIENFLQ